MLALNHRQHTMATQLFLAPAGMATLASILKRLLRFVAPSGVRACQIKCYRR